MRAPLKRASWDTSTPDDQRIHKSLDFRIREAYPPARDTGDVLTGDGIERVSEEQCPPAPDDWGEGGSVLQALGSKGKRKRSSRGRASKEERSSRRTKRKSDYAKYLESATWKKIRAAALKRDEHTCRACKLRATVVHHVRYPTKLGEERMEWLYSLCATCHDGIHALAAQRGVTLRHATEAVLASPVVVETRVLPERPPRKKKKPKRKPSVRSTPTKTKKQKLADENERLHETFRVNRERRERRWDLRR